MPKVLFSQIFLAFWPSICSLKLCSDQLGPEHTGSMRTLRFKFKSSDNEYKPPPSLLNVKGRRQINQNVATEWRTDKNPDCLLASQGCVRWDVTVKSEKAPSVSCITSEQLSGPQRTHKWCQLQRWGRREGRAGLERKISTRSLEIISFLVSKTQIWLIQLHK